MQDVAFPFLSRKPRYLIVKHPRENLQRKCTLRENTVDGSVRPYRWRCSEWLVPVTMCGRGNSGSTSAMTAGAEDFSLAA